MSVHVKCKLSGKFLNFICIPKFNFPNTCCNYRYFTIIFNYIIFK